MPRSPPRARAAGPRGGRRRPRPTRRRGRRARSPPRSPSSHRSRPPAALPWRPLCRADGGCRARRAVGCTRTACGIRPPCTRAAVHPADRVRLNGAMQTTPPATTATKRRVPLWDNARWIAITLVVIGHGILPLISEDDLAYSVYLFIYSFHVAVFVTVA